MIEKEKLRELVSMWRELSQWDETCPEKGRVAVASCADDLEKLLNGDESVIERINP